MIKNFILFGFFLGLLHLTLAFNPRVQVVYSSNTRVEYNSGSKSLEFSTKLYTKNIELAIGIKSTDPEFDKNLSRYLTNNFRVLVNGIPRGLKYAGKQVNTNTARVFFEVGEVEDNIRSIEIKNALLIEKFPNQQNFVNLEVKGQRSSFVCKKGEETGKVLY